jgi:hypothetical protein
MDDFPGAMVPTLGSKTQRAHFFLYSRPVHAVTYHMLRCTDQMGPFLASFRPVKGPPACICKASYPAGQVLSGRGIVLRLQGP